MINEHKISFIMCVNDDQARRESEYFLSLLELPQGMDMDVIAITDARSMTEGYNRAMNSSDAKYKVYMHQDVLVIRKDFIGELLKIFANPDVGMIGMVGAPLMPEGGIMWNGPRVGSLYSHNFFKTKKVVFDAMNNGFCQSVEAIDGFLMATQYDVPWREDIFKGWDFYDVSQSFEFRKAGYSVVVPHQDPPWCLHDDGWLNLSSYFDNKRVFQREYADMLA